MKKGLIRQTMSLRNEHGRAALTESLLSKLKKQLKNATQTQAQYALLLEGEGSAFCEGMDLSQNMNLERSLVSFRELLEMLRVFPGPVVSCVHGDVRGGGLGLLACSDLVIASPNASFALPEALVGLIPAFIFPYLCQRISASRVKLLALSTISLTAEEAKHWGIVDEVGSDMEKGLKKFLTRWERVDPRSFAELKGLTNQLPIPESYFTDGLKVMAKLFHSSATQKRIESFNAGGLPWEND